MYEVQEHMYFLSLQLRVLLNCNDDNCLMHRAAYNIAYMIIYEHFRQDEVLKMGMEWFSVLTVIVIKGTSTVTNFLFCVRKFEAIL